MYSALYRPRGGVRIFSLLCLSGDFGSSELNVTLVVIVVIVKINIAVEQWTGNRSC